LYRVFQSTSKPKKASPPDAKNHVGLLARMTWSWRFQGSVNVRSQDPIPGESKRVNLESTCSASPGPTDTDASPVEWHRPTYPKAHLSDSARGSALPEFLAPGSRQLLSAHEPVPCGTSSSDEPSGAWPSDSWQPAWPIACPEQP